MIQWYPINLSAILPTRSREADVAGWRVWVFNVSRSVCGALGLWVGFAVVWNGGAAREIIIVPGLLDGYKRTRKDRYLFSIDTHGQTDVPPPTHHRITSSPAHPCHHSPHQPIKKPKGKFLNV